MTDRQPRPDDVWHRNPMVWLIIAIPALTVLGCLITIVLAITSPDEIVSDYRLRTDTGIEERDVAE